MITKTWVKLIYFLFTFIFQYMIKHFTHYNQKTVKKTVIIVL